MKKIVLLVLFLLLPAYAGAAYTIYLKNGAEIPEVTSYSESGGDVYLYFGTGSMIVPKKDILRIGGSETTEKETAREKRNRHRIPGDLRKHNRRRSSRHPRNRILLLLPGRMTKLRD